MRAPWPIRVGYRAILLLYPAGFRRDAGPAMMADLDRCWRRARDAGGRFGTVRFGLRQLMDLAGNVTREWRGPSGRAPIPVERSGLRGTWNDVRSAERSLRRDPLFTGVVVLVAGLGIGGVVTAWGLLEAILLEPLPYPGAERMVSVIESFRDTQFASASYPNFVDWRDRNRAFDGFAARRRAGFNLTGKGDARLVRGHGASAELFELFGVETTRGRFLTRREVDEAAHVVVVSDTFWRNVLGGDEGVLGRGLRLDGELFTVVGVAPPLPEFPLDDAQLWVPLTTSLGARSIADRSNHPGIEAFGRTREGVSFEQGVADLKRVAAALRQEYPATNSEAGVLVRPVRDRLIDDADDTLWTLFLAVSLVMAGVCANVASLLLARATRRASEIAVRSALGAGRGRMARQLFAEGLLLSTAAGGIGLVAAWFTLGLVRGADTLELPRLATVGIDSSVALFAIGASTLSGLLFAAAPALRTLRTDPAHAMRSVAVARGATYGGRRGRSALVVVQVALAVMLLSGAGLMLRTLANLARIDTGIDPGNVVTAYLAPSPSRYPTSQDRAALYRVLAERVAALPGVRAVSGGDPLPMSGYDNFSTLSNDGFPQVDERGLRVDVSRIMPGYFDVMGIRQLAGRDFRHADGVEEPVAIVDSELAAFLWPEGDVLGNRLRFHGPAEESTWFTVVGVVGHVRSMGPRSESRYGLYLPMTISVWGTSLLADLEPGLDPAPVVDGIRAELARLDPEVPLSRIGTVRANITGSVATEAIVARTLSGFAAATLLVAMIGLYGVIAYSVALRRREFGIRMALGAGRAAVLTGVLREGAALTVAGLGLGLLGAIAASSWLASLLYGVAGTDPWILAAVAAVMGVVALCASLVPARHAVRVDPASALRD